MNDLSVPSARLRVRILCAGLAALLCACGPGGPKRKTDDGSGGGGTGTGITLLAGDAATSGFADAKGSAARFNTPRGLAVDAGGNVYVADPGNFTIRRIAADGTVTTFAGMHGVSASKDGKGTGARFSLPTALAFDADGNLFVVDDTSIRKITSDGTVSTLTSLDFGQFGVEAQNLPAGIAVDGAGNLYVTSGVDTRRIPVSNPNRAVKLETGSVADIYGTKELVPRGVAVNSDNLAYVADLTRTLGTATTGATALTRFVGAANQSGTADGNTSVARFQQLVALAVDKSGNIYGADALSNTIRKITKDGVVSTPAGKAGTSTLKTGGLPGNLATVRGIAVDANGVLYATSGNAVVKIVLQ